MTQLTETLQGLYRTYQSGDFIRAEVGIRSALQAWPNQPDVLRLGALTALGVNQVVTADQRLFKAEKLSPMTAELANTRGNILKASGEWAGAEAAYEMAERLDPNYGPVKANKLDMFIQSGQPRRALDLLENDTSFGEMGAYAKSQALENLSRHEEALEVLESEPAGRYEEHFMLQRIKCLAALDRLDEMKAAFDSLPPASRFASDALGLVVNAYEMRNMRSDALDVIEKISASPEASPHVLIRGVNLLRRAGRTGMSKAALDTANERFTQNPDVITEQANAALLNGEADISCDLYKKALSLRPADLGALMGFAQAAIVSGNYSQAQTAIQGGLAQAPNNQFLLALAATLMRAMGQDHTQFYDYKNFVRTYDLVPPDGFSNMVEFNIALKSKLDELHIYTGTPVNQSLRGGTQTEVDLALVEDPIIQSFFKAVDAPIRDYMSRLDKTLQHPLHRRTRDEYRINGAWSVRLSEAGHHVNHVHPMGWLSSAYYVDLPSSVNARSREGWIQFGEPSLDADLPAEHFVQPKAGRLVLFPSYMWHGTVPFKGAETRLTLPFDVVPA